MEQESDQVAALSHGSISARPTRKLRNKITFSPSCLTSVSSTRSRPSTERRVFTLLHNSSPVKSLLDVADGKLCSADDGGVTLDALSASISSLESYSPPRQSSHPPLSSRKLSNELLLVIQPTPISQTIKDTHYSSSHPYRCLPHSTSTSTATSSPPPPFGQRHDFTVDGSNRKRGRPAVQKEQKRIQDDEECDAVSK